MDVNRPSYYFIWFRLHGRCCWNNRRGVDFTCSCVLGLTQEVFVSSFLAPHGTCRRYQEKHSIVHNQRTEQGVGLPWRSKITTNDVWGGNVGSLITFHLIEIRCQKKSDEGGRSSSKIFFCKSSIPERTCIGNFQEYIDNLGVWEDSKDFNATLFFLCTGLHPNWKHSI